MLVLSAKMTTYPVRHTEDYADREVWITHYQEELQEMHSIFASELFPDFSLFAEVAYLCTQPRMNYEKYKLLRPLL